MHHGKENTQPIAPRYKTKDMLTEEQIQWLVPIFNTVYDILSKIPDIEPASKRGHRINATYFNPCYSEFFFDKDKGLFEVIYFNQ